MKAAVGEAAAFVDWLAGLPSATWLDIGRSLGADLNRCVAHAIASAILDATIADCGLSVAAWYVRDAVATAVLLAGADYGSASERRILSCAQQAAEEAALALLARDQLSPADFAVLYAPFADAQRTRVTPRPGVSGI